MNLPSDSGDSRPKRGKLLLMTHMLSPRGGGNCVSAWALQALCEEWDVTLLCEETPDIDAVNRYYGTWLKKGEFTVRTLPWLKRILGKLDPDPQSIQPLAWLIRTCQRVGGDFDVIMSVANEVDTGHQAIQYTHYPIYAPQMPTLRKYAGTSFWFRLKGLIRGEYRPWMIITRSQPDRIEQNLFLANSHWTARVIREFYTTEPKVLYPPVRLAEATLPWTSRQPAFVVLGRLTKIKRQVLAIDLLEQVRKRGHAVDLHIIGDPDPKDQGQYAEDIQQRAQEAGSWVKVHISVERQELDTILANSRFGLHMMEEEHFGIAIAEMMSFGCIVFVPNGGGQVEIVGQDSGLTFDSQDDAVSRICNLLDDPGEQQRLSKNRRERARMFSANEFMARLQRIVVKSVAVKQRSD